MSEGYRLVYPTRKIGNKDFNIYYPINKETGEKIEKEIVNKLKEVLKNNDRHSNAVNTHR
jgi:DNA-binding cell septation regulator SpoVG